jgi:acyl carrier protein
MLDHTVPETGSATLDGPPENLIREIAALIVASLNLEVDAATIEADTPLYGEGLGLDSIDILEVALEVSKRFGVQLQADDNDNVRIFTSLRTLADYVWRNRTA